MAAEDLGRYGVSRLVPVLFMNETPLQAITNTSQETGMPTFALSLWQEIIEDGEGQHTPGT